MLYNATSLFSQVLVNYTNYVFGSYIFTVLMIFLLFFIIGLLVKIPLAINLSLYIPLSIVLMSMGILPIVAGATLIIILMVLVGISLASNF
jgi:hypothetical protein